MAYELISCFVLLFFCRRRNRLFGPSRSAPSADTPGGRRWGPSHRRDQLAFGAKPLARFHSSCQPSASQPLQADGILGRS
ncbi:hypothetical protein V8C43DRAFT_277014 [Trichoderma afarasin]